MHRFFVDPQFISDTAVSFPPEQAHQLRTVLRMNVGDAVVVLDNDGQAYDVTLTHIEKRQVLGEITARYAAGGEPGTHITLYMALLKRDNFEWVLQKGTEIGVTRFVPLLTARTVVAAKTNKQERWQRILTEAAEQCRRGRIPELTAPQPLSTAAAAHGADIALIPWEEATQITLAAALAAQPVRSVALFIGPEGGFAESEVENGRLQGLIPVTLGPRILRAETAAIVAATLTLQACGDL
ncbi:MAG: 16S rRNA (uracil(1498)-N(3))-methyltransferase [Ardenticatenaceae bacterium]|nr:16S rRNA (uracil(1498)-N(3))-methyltransferase [Ardenticatenaceae bacterium]